MNTTRGVLLKTFADIAIRASGLVTFPVVARHLGADGYGAYAQVTTVVGVVVPLASIGLGSVMVRYFSAQPWSSLLARQILRIGGLVLAFGTVFTLALVAAAPLLNDTFLGYPNGDALFRWGSLLVVTGALEYWSLDLLRARYWLTQFVVFQVGQTAVLVAATVVLLTHGFGLVALLQAAAAIKLASVAGVCVGLWLHARGAPAGETDSQPPGVGLMIRFGFPLTVAGLGVWMVNLSDRLVVGGKLGAAQLGRYGIVYNLGALMVVASAGLFVPAYTRLVREAVAGEGAHVAADIRLFHRYLVLATVPLALWLAVVIQPTARVLGGREFHVHLAVVLLVVAALSLHQWNGLAHYLLIAYDHTTLLQNIWVAAGFLNVGACLVLVPPMGLEGAALATLICFLVIEGWVFTKASRHINLMRNYRFDSTLRAGIAGAAGVGAVEAVFAAMPDGGAALVAATAAFFLVYAVGIALFREFGRTEIDLLLRALRPAPTPHEEIV